MGRVEGRDGIADLFRTAMAGLDGWTYPIEFTAISGNDVVIKWLQVIPGLLPNGQPLVHSGVSTMVYAGNGEFSYEEDLMNVAQVTEDLANAAWQPGPGFTMPPRNRTGTSSDPTPRSATRSRLTMIGRPRA